MNAVKDLFIYDKTTRYTYKKLSKSSVYDKLKYMFDTKHDIMIFEHITVANKNYLIALSKFVSYRINTNKQAFRAKKDMILIDQIATYLAKNLVSSGKCNLFSNFNMIAKSFKLKQKECKIFKLLLAERLLLLLYEIETELIDISNVIKSAKISKRVHKFHKKLLFDAQIYSIENFNPNSTKILYNLDLDIKALVTNLFHELFYAEQRLNIIVSYLITMFN